MERGHEQPFSCPGIYSTEELPDGAFFFNQHSGEFVTGSDHASMVRHLTLGNGYHRGLQLLAKQGYVLGYHYNPIADASLGRGGWPPAYLFLQGPSLAVFRQVADTLMFDHPLLNVQVDLCEDFVRTWDNYPRVEGQTVRDLSNFKKSTVAELRDRARLEKWPDPDRT